MEKITSEINLRTAIVELEAEQVGEGKILKQQFLLAYESIKPLNLIKSTFAEVASSEVLRDSLVNATVGLAAGYISKKLFESVAHSPLRKLLGTMVMFGITNAVAKNPDAVKALGKGAFRVIAGISQNAAMKTENIKTGPTL